MTSEKHDEEARPRHGDKTLNGWTVDYATEEVVWFVGQSNPVQLENIAPADQPGVWKLIRLKSTDED